MEKSNQSTFGAKQNVPRFHTDRDFQSLVPFTGSFHWFLPGEKSINKKNPISNAIDVGIDACEIVTPRPQQRLWILWSVLIGLGFVGRLLYGYEVDELMHLHTAWCIGQGQLPYRDFYDNHLPVWHYLIAPFVASLHHANFGVLLGCRLFALAILLLGLCLFYRLTKRIMIAAAPWSVGAYLLIHPFGTTGFELRPDWTALVCLLGAILLLLKSLEAGATGSDEVSIEDRAGRTIDRQSVALSFGGGLLGGLSVGMTQKSAFLLLGIIVWLAGSCLLATDKVQKRRRIVCLLAMLVGAAVPILLLVWWFASRGALNELVEYGIRQNLRWMREAPLLSGAQESLMANFPIFALAFVRLIQIARTLKTHMYAATAESLVAVIFVFGIIAFLKTPVPLAQWFLFLVVPWAACLGTASLYDFARSPDQFTVRSGQMVIGCLLAFAALRWYNALIVLVVWVGLLAIFGGRLKRTASPDRRVTWAFALSLGVGVIVYLGRVAAEIVPGNGRIQAAFIADIEGRLAPNEPLLAPWPNLAPFHPCPTYHTFAIGGIYTTLSVEALQDEYIGVVAEGRTRIVVMRPRDVDKWQPRFAAYAREHGRLIRRDTVNLRTVEAYVFDNSPYAKSLTD